MKPLPRHRDAGYTIIELIVIMVILAVLAAIAAPSWLVFLNRQRLNNAQAEVVTAIRETQSKAKQQKREWQVCIQDDTTLGKVRWFVRPVPSTGGNCSNGTPGPWNNLIESDANKIKIDTANSRLDNGYYSVTFQYNGWVVDPAYTGSSDVNKITFLPRTQTSGTRRCVFVATLLGAVRTANDGDCTQ